MRKFCILFFALLHTHDFWLQKSIQILKEGKI